MYVRTYVWMYTYTLYIYIYAPSDATPNPITVESKASISIFIARVAAGGDDCWMEEHQTSIPSNSKRIVPSPPAKVYKIHSLESISTHLIYIYKCS